MSQQVQRRTFYLLGCESCGRFAPPPARPELPDFVRQMAEPMRCECGELLLLAECFVAPETTMWHRGPGDMWKHVAYLETLPDRDGRLIWMAA